MAQNRKAWIGVFDSGFGGLDVLRGIVKELPQYNYIYLGDTARAPYGSRSPEVIYAFLQEAVSFLFKNGCELIILACNTASSDALRKIQQEHLPLQYPGKKVLGVLIPAAEAVAGAKRVGVLATERTVKSGVFARELTKINPNIEVIQKACPLLVHLVEAGEQNSNVARLILEEYVAPLCKEHLGTLILGCTHYGVFAPAIQEILGSGVRVISEADVVPKKLKKYLERHPDIEQKIGREKARRFCSTDLTDGFLERGGGFFGSPIQVERVVL